MRVFLATTLASALFFNTISSAVTHSRDFHKRHQHSSIRAEHPQEQEPVQQRAIIERASTPNLQLQVFYGYTQAYDGWITAWLNQNTDAPTQQIRQQYAAFSSAASSWLTQAMSSSSSDPTNLPALQAILATYHDQITGWFSAQPPSSIESQQLQQDYTAFSSWTTAWLTTNNAASSGQGSTPASPPSSNPSPNPTLAAALSTAAASSAAAPATPVAVGATSTIILAPIPAGPTDVAIDTGNNNSSSSIGKHVVDAARKGRSATNLAVYWGASPWTHQASLARVCTDPSVSIVILAFLTSFTGNNGNPQFSIGNGDCMTLSSTDPGCSKIAKDIKTCQKAGRKVMLSMGGASAGGMVLTSDQQATQAATKLWNLFGAGTGEPARLRPFGSVILDGFDIDLENNQPAHLDTLTTALRSKMHSGSRKFYISGAPQCPIPDASIPLAAMRAMDYVWVQFYNNPGCGVGSAGFAASLKQWSQQLLVNGKGPTVYIGAPACPGCAGSGYTASPQTLRKTVQGAIKGIKNFGGMMLWEGSGALVAAGGANYLSIAKAAIS